MLQHQNATESLHVHDQLVGVVPGRWFDSVTKHVHLTLYAASKKDQRFVSSL